MGCQERNGWIGQLLFDIYRNVTNREVVGAFFLGGNMGFKYSALLSPQQLREYVASWHKCIAEAEHSHGKPFLLHSCGNLEAIMEDLIEDVWIGAKHGFQDVMMLVSEVKAKYGKHIAILVRRFVFPVLRTGPHKEQRKGFTHQIVKLFGNKETA